MFVDESLVNLWCGSSWQPSYVREQALEMFSADLQDHLPCLAADNRILDHDNKVLYRIGTTFQDTIYR